MKAPAFDVHRATSLPEVFALLKTHGDDARLLAGGQTLLATLNMRLSEPRLLIDLNGLDSLRGIAVTGRVLRIGALATHGQIEASPLVAQHAPMLAQAAPHIAHRAIRNRGTFGGSLAYADPAAEWPACVLALDATLLAQSERGERRIPAADFFEGIYATALAADELLTACEVPLPEADERQHFDELARRHGDYAIAGIAARARRQGGKLHAPRLAFLGIADRPVRAVQTEALIEGRACDDALLTDADRCLRTELDPQSDLTNGAETKRQLAAVLLRRALRRLAEQD